MPSSHNQPALHPAILEVIYARLNMSLTTTAAATTPIPRPLLASDQIRLVRRSVDARPNQQRVEGDDDSQLAVDEADNGVELYSEVVDEPALLIEATQSADTSPWKSAGPNEHDVSSSEQIEFDDAVKHHNESEKIKTPLKVILSPLPMTKKPTVLLRVPKKLSKWTRK